MVRRVRKTGATTWPTRPLMGFHGKCWRTLTSAKKDCQTQREESHAPASQDGKINGPEEVKAALAEQEQQSRDESHSVLTRHERIEYDYKQTMKNWAQQSMRKTILQSLVLPARPRKEGLRISSGKRNREKSFSIHG